MKSFQIEHACGNPVSDRNKYNNQYGCDKNEGVIDFKFQGNSPSQYKNVKKICLKWTRSCIAFIFGGLALILGGCSHSGHLHPFVGQRGLLMPIQNPDGLVSNTSSLTLYLGDSYNERQEGGQVLYGHLLSRKLKEFMGGQVASVCRTLPCYVEAAKAWNNAFVLAAIFQKNDDSPRPEGVLRITRWSVDPLFPEATVTVPFPLDAVQPSFEKILQQGIDRMIAQILSSRKRETSFQGNEPDSHLRGMIAAGDIDQALQLGERVYSDPFRNKLSKDFYYTLYSLEESTGKLEMAKRVGDMAVKKGLASKSLIIKMAENAKGRGEWNEGRNILFKGLEVYPNDREFWRYLIRDHIYEGEFQKALQMIRQFEAKNPPIPAHPHFVIETYAILVGMGQGEKADRWYQAHIPKDWADVTEPSPFLAHAVVTRYFQQGKWKKAATTVEALIGRGIDSKEMYRDWMTALGAENNPIKEVRVGREALARGIRSRWIRDQVTYLEQKGY
jgi:tetratricopeptide (TPR) repeat protein